MLLRIKDRITGWFAYLVVGLISVPFALWGINFYFQEGGNVTILEIGDQKVDLRNFNEAFIQNKRFIESTSNQEVPDRVVKSRTLTNLLRKHLLDQELQDHRYTVPDFVLAEYIAESEEFQVDGVFNREAYLRFLQLSNYTQQSFEDEIRGRLKVDQFQTAINTSGFVTDAEQQEFEDFYLQERDIRFVIFPPEKFMDPDSVTEEQVRKQYDDNQETYQTQLRARFAYVEVKLEDFYDQVDLQEDDLQAYYEDHFEELVGPESRTVAHILISPERQGGEIAAQRLADEVYEKLLQGEDFAALAQNYSDDSLTAADGGRLDPLTRDSLDDEEIEEAIFTLAPDEFSKPVESSFGIQIFKLLETSSSVTAAFADYRDTVEERLRDEQAFGFYNDMVFDVSTLAFEDIFSLDPIADELGIEIQQSDWVTIAQEEGLFSNRQIQKVAFGSEVIDNENNSELLEYDKGKAIVLRVLEKEVPRQQSYEEVEEDIFAALRLENAVKTAKQQIQDMLTKLITGDSLDDFATQYDLYVQEPGFIRRQEQNLLPQVVRIAFAAQILKGDKKDESGRGYNFGQLSNNDQILLEVREIRRGETDPNDPVFSHYSNEMNMFLQELADSMHVYINQEALADPEEI